MQVTNSNTQTLLTLIRHYREQPLKSGFDVDGLERWQAALHKLDDGVSAVAVEEDAILKNRELSDDGKRTKLTALAGRVVQNVSWLGRMLQDADTAKARLEALLFGPITARPKGEPVLQFLREQEIRQQLGSASSSERNTQYLLGLEGDDLETARALLDAPGPKWVPEDIRRRGEEAYAQRTNPAAWDKLQAVEYLREHLGSLAEQTARWLVTLGATPASVQMLKAKG